MSVLRTSVDQGFPNGESKQVWILRDGQPVPIPVQTGASNGRQTEITGGELKAGAAVIVDYQEKAK